MKQNKAFANLVKSVEKLKAGSGYKNENEGKFWKLEGDKAKNGSAVIRFLPGKTEDDDVFVKVFAHGFKADNGKWFIEECPTTVGGDCPVCAKNGELWNSGIEANKEIVRKRKRKLSYIANILVIEDKANPDNEGKVFLFKFGQKIFEKITDKLTPQFEDEVAFNPTDPYEGADFKLKMRQVEGFANFDKSEFKDPSQIDMDIQEMIGQLHDLKQFVDPTKFKSYEEIEKKFNSVINGRVGGASTPSKSSSNDDDDDDDKFLRQAEQAKPQPAKKASAPVQDNTDDDDMEYFKKLAEETND